MSTHFLALIGTSLYEPIIYTEDGFISTEQEFIQLAIIEKYKEEFLTDPDSRITFFMTTKAEEQNVNDRPYSAFEASRAKNWATTRIAEIKEGSTKKGMRSQFEEQFPELAGQVEWKHIEDAQTEDQIRTVFNDIYNSLRENDAIIFDITHSFRSIPMLAMTVINYAKVLKNCTLKQICYGAYEAAPKPEPGKSKYAPINDLTVYDDILSWTNAADTFMRFGNASMITECFNRSYLAAPGEKKAEWSAVKKVIKSAGELSDSILTSRGVDTGLVRRIKNSKSQYSIKAAYEDYAAKVSNAGISKASEIAPLVPLMEKINDRFSIMNRANNYEVGMAVVEWSIQNGMVQQGYTALEESIITYMCWRYGLNEVLIENREGIVGTCLWQLAHKSQDECAQYLEERKEKDAESYPVMQLMMCKENKPIARLLSDIQQFRNDINHFGMRASDVHSSSDLRKNLLTEYSRFKEIVDEEERKRQLKEPNMDTSEQNMDVSELNSNASEPNTVEPNTNTAEPNMNASEPNTNTAN